jgi:hypothetical protein
MADIRIFTEAELRSHIQLELAAIATLAHRLCLKYQAGTLFKS